MPGVQVTGEATPDTTGAFEVQIVGGPLVHSKLGGAGHVTDANRQTVFDSITSFAVKNQ